MLKKISVHFKLILHITVFIGISGCAVQLAPSFSQNLLDGVTQSNEETQVLLTSLESGSSRSEYQNYSERYDTTIGKLKALEILAEARPAPSLSQRGINWLKSEGVLAEICPVADECVNPTPSILETIHVRLGEMKSIHQRAGLDSITVASVHNFASSQFELIISFENALQR